MSIEWFYLDPSGLEHGPFVSESMRDWCDRGCFDVGRLMVRASYWCQHRRLADVYPGGPSEWFRIQPREAEAPRRGPPQGWDGAGPTRARSRSPPSGRGWPPAQPPPGPCALVPAHGYGFGPPVHAEVGYHHYDYGSPGYAPPAPGGSHWAPPPYGYGHPGQGYGYGPPPAPRWASDRDDRAKGRSKGSAQSRASHFELNKQIIKWSELVVKGQRTLRDLLGDVDESLDRMNEVNVSTAFHRVAKICRSEGSRAADATRSDARFRRLKERVRAGLLENLALLGRDGADTKRSQVPMSVACICWAYATLRLQDASLFSQVASACAARGLSGFKGLELCNLLWAFAKLGERGRESQGLFKAGASEALRRPGDFNVVNLSTLVWAFATARVRHHDLFMEVGERIVRSISTAESQEIANTMWAFATVGIFDEALLSKMRQEAVVKLKTFKAQEAANVAWALGRAAAPGTFFEALADDLRARAGRDELGHFEPQHFSMILSAASTLHLGRAEDPADGEAHDTEPAAAGGGLLPRQLVLELLEVLLPSCSHAARRFKPEEAQRITSGCERLGLLAPGAPEAEAEREAARLSAHFAAAVRPPGAAGPAPG